MHKAVLLINLGTPDTPSVKDVGRYLREFLNDPRVIDLPALRRYFLVNFLIIPFRKYNSAKLYKSIWTERGSPLLFHSEDLAQKLAAEMGTNYRIYLAMRYGSPPIKNVVEKIIRERPEEILIVPLYPQYASSSTGTVVEEVFKALSRHEVIPGVKVLKRFYDDQGVLDAWAAVSRDYATQDYDHVLFSYHGLPERQILKASAENGSHCCLQGDCCGAISDSNYYCYRANSFDNTRLLAAKLNIPAGKFSVSFQSRLGKEEWIKPYTEDVIRELAGKGVKKLLVYSPAFVADCLETIEEIGGEYNELFLSLGGKKLQLVPSLNAHSAWVKALEGMIRRM